MKPTPPTPAEKRKLAKARLIASLDSSNPNFMVPLEPKKPHHASKFASGIFRTI